MKKESLIISGARQLGLCMETMNPCAYFTTYTKPHLKWIRDLIIKVKTFKLLEEPIGKYLHYARLSKDFLGYKMY